MQFFLALHEKLILRILIAQPLVNSLSVNFFLEFKYKMSSFITHFMMETIISSKTRIKLLMKFFINSQNTSYLRSLEEEFGESSNAIRLELNKFEKAGFLESYVKGNKKLFAANTKHPLFKNINEIILKMVGIEYIIDYVLQRIGDLEKVFLIGKLSKGQNADVVDLVLVGNNLNKAFLSEQIEKAEKKIKRKIKYVHYSTQEFDMDRIKEPEMHPLLLWSKK